MAGLPVPFQGPWLPRGASFGASGVEGGIRSGLPGFLEDPRGFAPRIAERLARAEEELRAAQQALDGSPEARMRYARARGEHAAVTREAEDVLRCFGERLRRPEELLH